MKDVRNERDFPHVRGKDAFSIVRNLKACAEEKDLVKGSKLHSYVQDHSYLERDCYVASALVSMYARCGAFSKAIQVLNRITVNVVAWNALIAGYVQQGRAEEALECFISMQREGQSPDVVSFICALKACGSIGSTTEGEKIHEQVVSLGMLEKSSTLGNVLIDMYARCGALAKARKVLNELPVRNVVTWTALMTGYTQHGQGHEALKCFDSMQREGHFPNAVTFICALKACGSVGAIVMGEKIHHKIASLDILEKNIVLGSTLVDMYARCGALAKAHQVLLELPSRDTVSWNVLISGYVQRGQPAEALLCFDNMQHEGHCPDAVTFTCALKACARIGATTKGEKIHDTIENLGVLKKNIVLGNALIDMYARCGALEKAQRVFNELPVRDVVTWNALIAGYAQQEQGEDALKCFYNMECEGHVPDVVTFICALKGCGSIGAAFQGESIHIKIVNLGILENNIVLGNTLVDMYARCGALAKAQLVLEELCVRDETTWNALIGGYVQHDHSEKALTCFDIMQCEGHTPDEITFVCALKACGNMRKAMKGEKIHDEILSLGMLDKNIVLGTALVDMYARCGALARAQEVFGKLPVRNLITWNALIGGYAQQGQGEEALKCFDNMQREGQTPDEVAFICALKACGSIGAITKGEQMHDEIVSLGLLGKSVVLAGMLVDMYARCGALEKAQEVLSKLPVRDVVMWTSLITGYAQQGFAEEALKQFDYMLCEGHFPTVATFVCALRACGSMGAATKGEQIHDIIVSLGLLEEDFPLGNTILDMYVKCGVLSRAVEVLEELPVQDTVTWNTLLGGYAQQGQTWEALNLLEMVQSKGFRPDTTTLVCVLNACSNSGLLDQAEVYFSKMNTKYDISPDLEHHCCMVDLFGRAGRFNRALVVIEQMPCGDYYPLWVALLGACCIWGHAKIGRLAFEQAHCLGENDASVYVSMANIYTAASMQEDADMMKGRRGLNGTLKMPVSLS